MKNDEKKPNVREQPLTYDDYAALPGDARYELAGGVLELMSPAPSSKHQAVVLELVSLVRQTCKSEYIIFIAPIDLILADTEVRQPDLVMVSRDRMAIITRRGIEGVPDLVAEVLSPRSIKRDRESKLRVYAQYGIPEYWIVDHAHETLEQYLLSGESYGIPHVYERDETVSSDRLRCVCFTMGQIMTAVVDIPD